MSKIEIDLDFEYLDKLPYEEYNKLEEKFLEVVVKSITKAEEDYCRKKDTTREKIQKDFISYNKMRNAIDKRKNIRKLANTLMKFNKVLRPYLKDTTLSVHKSQEKNK